MAPAPTRRLAPAKINLWLHVGPLGSDGYHPIHSLMVFADLGDRLALRRGADRPLKVTGPFAAALAGDNLVDRARALLADSFPGQVSGFALELEKHLPVAAGLGGGSADAAAALRLMRDALALPASDEDLAALAERLGADVPACLLSRPLIAEGRGERLSIAPALPRMPAVLVNPGVPVSTAEVFRAFDAEGASAGPLAPPSAPPIETVAGLATWLAATRNDLQAAAVRQQPQIGEVLSWLAVQAETVLARMSGSGGTVFALCADATRAATLAKRLAAIHPAWWARACALDFPVGRGGE